MYKLGRNELCLCGSGIKYKYCCYEKHQDLGIKGDMLKILHFEGNRRFKMPREWRERYGDLKPIIHEDIGGYKFVAVGNTLYWSKRWKFFNEFLEEYVLHVLGLDWCKGEIQKDFSDRHIVLQWRESMYEYLNKHGERDGNVFYVDVNGITKAYLLLAYDLYILRHHSSLQNEVVRRLKLKDHFQGARYELFVASIFVRAGFDISFEEESDPSKKHPEFIAQHKASKQKFAVEAKSRHRPGILNFPGDRSEDEVAGVKYLLWKAFDKDVQMPYAIFIDLNLPPSDDPFFKRTWFEEIPKSIDQIIQSHGFKTDPFNFIYFTNHPYHYADQEDQSPRSDSFAAISRNPRIKGDYKKIFNAVMKVMDSYDVIPNRFEDAD